jgi:LemA protein
MKGALIILGVLILVGLVFGGQLMGQRNELVTERNEIEGRWAQVDNDMKRRADLIPNLVETVKGYAKQEQTVIGEVANARAALLGAHSKQEDELAGTENRIAVDRRDYNGAIQKYNTDIDLFPKNIAASLFGFHRDDAYFKTTEEEKKVPQVKF